jgi:hypothetical protein
MESFGPRRNSCQESGAKKTIYRRRYESYITENAGLGRQAISTASRPSINRMASGTSIGSIAGIGRLPGRASNHRLSDCEGGDPNSSRPSTLLTFEPRVGDGPKCVAGDDRPEALIGLPRLRRVNAIVQMLASEASRQPSVARRDIGVLAAGEDPLLALEPICQSPKPRASGCHGDLEPATIGGGEWTTRCSLPGGPGGTRTTAEKNAEIPCGINKYTDSGGAAEFGHPHSAFSRCFA